MSAAAATAGCRLGFDGAVFGLSGSRPRGCEPTFVTGRTRGAGRATFGRSAMVGRRLVSPNSIFRSSTATAVADLGRSDAILDSIRRMRLDNAAGTAGSTWRGAGGWQAAGAIRQQFRALKRRAVRRQQVEHAAEAKQVGPTVDCLGTSLFWRHITQRPEDDAGLRDAVLDFDWLGQAEIENFHSILRRLEP